VAVTGDENAGRAPAIHAKEWSRVMKRRRFKQKASLQERLNEFARDARERASALPPGPEREELIKKARQADTALHLEGWANSPGLQPPK
jgi:hypothetical protein